MIFGTIPVFSAFTQLYKNAVTFYRSTSPQHTVTLLPMKRVLLLICTLTFAAMAQPVRTLGELTAKDSAAKTLTIKPDTGEPVTVKIDETTVFMRVPPGETSLAKAAKIKGDDLAVGDRVLATGSAPAARVIVMTKGDLQQKQAAETAEWQKRGTNGTVTSVDPASKQLTVKRRAMGTETTLTVSTNEKTQYRRYAPDSVKFNQAKASNLGEIKTGDQVRILAVKPAEDGKLDAEVIVSGTFRNVAGTVISTDVAANEITIKDLESKKPLIVKVNADSALHKMPPMMAQMLAARANGAASGATAQGGMPGQRPAGAGGQGSGGGPATGGPGGPPAGGPGMGSAGMGAPGGARGPGGPGMGGLGGPGGPGGSGGMRGGGDIQQMLERMPAFQISELKPGDALIVNSTAGTDPSRVTAISLLAGVEPLLTAPTPQGDRRLSGAWNMGDMSSMQ